MITDRDIKKMKTVFATKDDLKRFATKDDFNQFVTKKDLRSDLMRMENRIINKFNEVVDYFDDKIINHEKRISTLESHRASL
jgi:hypothetical protein